VLNPAQTKGHNIVADTPGRHLISETHKKELRKIKDKMRRDAAEKSP
jgi:hypothetical protein